MADATLYDRLGLTRAWSRELALAGLALAVGFALMPILIFYSGSLALGRYDGASLPTIFGSVYHGLAQASFASWCVVLGPYGLYLLLRLLHLWWRVGGPRP